MNIKIILSIMHEYSTYKYSAYAISEYSLGLYCPTIVHSTTPLRKRYIVDFQEIVVPV